MCLESWRQIHCIFPAKYFTVCLWSVNDMGVFEQLIGSTVQMVKECSILETYIVMFTFQRPYTPGCSFWPVQVHRDHTRGFIKHPRCELFYRLCTESRHLVRHSCDCLWPIWTSVCIQNMVALQGITVFTFSTFTVDPTTCSQYTLMLNIILKCHLLFSLSYLF